MRVSHRRAAILAVLTCCLIAVAPVNAFAQDIEQPEIVATRAIVVNASTGDILLDKGANEPVPMASLTKLFTAFVAIESTPLDRQMVVSESDLVGEASMGVSAGEVLTFETLLNGMLLPSGNDAASVIARNLGMQPGDSDEQATQRFTDRVNARLAALGLNNTRLANPHGLDTEGHYSTARDIAALTLYALDYEPTFGATIGTATFEAEGHIVSNTNRLLGAYDGLIGGKTGVTDNAGYCLMQVAERDGQRIITVLLGSTPDAWYADAQALLDYGFAAAAVPGEATRYGQISFANASMPTVPAPQPVEGLAVTEAGVGSALVSQTSIADTPRRSPWLWIGAAGAIAPASLLTLMQVQRGMSRRSGPLDRRRPAPVAPRSTGYVSYHTGDLALKAKPVEHTAPVNWQHVAPEYHFDETTEWRIPANQPNRRRSDDRPRYPAFSPSFSGD